MGQKFEDNKIMVQIVFKADYGKFSVLIMY